MLKTLILKILNEGIQIKAATKGDLQNNEDGAYDPGECVGASIYILRETNGSYWISNEQNDVGNTDKFIRESTNSEKDLIILAHELGHHYSKTNGFRTKEYCEALSLVNKNMCISKEQGQIVMTEEERAWSFARQILSELGFTDCTRFDQEKLTGLTVYQKKLTLLLSESGLE